MDLLKHLILPRPGGHVPFTAVTPAPPSQQAVQTVQPVQQAPMTLHPAVLQYLLGNASPTASANIAARPQSASVVLDPRRFPRVQQRSQNNDVVETHPALVASTVSATAVTIPQPAGPAALDPQRFPTLKEWGQNNHVVEQPPMPVAGAANKTPPTAPEPVSEKSKSICSFWYHYGSCRNDPNSADYKMSGKACKYVHHLGPGTENMKVQKVPWQWHRDACGLERCEQRVGKEGNAAGAQEPSADVQDNKSTKALETEGRKGNTKPKQGSKRKRSDTDKTASPPTPAVSAPLAGHKMAQPKVAMAAARQKMSMVDSSLNRAVRGNATETCFFWYHGTCKRGVNCPMLHRLTSPPSFVQPPPDYMHYVPCGLAWCPGDHKHEHKQEQHNHSGHHAKKARTGESNLQGIAKEVNEEGAVYLKHDDGTSNSSEDWFLAGFPDSHE